MGDIGGDPPERVFELEESLLMDRCPAAWGLRRLLPAAVLVLVVRMHLSCASTMELPPISGIGGGSGSHLPGKFVWHALFTADVASARKFYGELLGWQFESPDGAEHYSIIRSGGMPIGAMVEVKPEAGVRVDQWISFLSVEDVDRAAERFPLPAASTGGPSICRNSAAWRSWPIPRERHWRSCVPRQVIRPMASSHASESGSGETTSRLRPTRRSVSTPTSWAGRLTASDARADMAPGSGALKQGERIG